MRKFAQVLESVARKRWRALAAVCVGALVGAALLTACRSGHGAAAVVTPYPHDLAQVTFAVAGDVIPHEPVRAAAKAAGDGEPGWAALFADVADVFEGADFGFVNLETPVAPEHSHGTKPFLFDAPVELPQALKASGIKIVSFANNHVMDQGWAGFVESREHLKEIGLLFAGTSDNTATAWQPVITEANGIKVGWLGMTRWLNGNRNPDKDDQPHVNFFPYPGEAGGAPGADEATVLAAIKAARAQCDLLVISVHWGIEYATAPRPEDVDIAHKMLEAGATVIVGAHPHVLQPIETYKTQDGRDTVIFYSLGNFLVEPVAQLCGRAESGLEWRSAGRDDRAVFRGEKGLRAGGRARGTGARGHAAGVGREQPQRDGRGTREEAGDQAGADRPRDSALAGAARRAEQERLRSPARS